MNGQGLTRRQTRQQIRLVVGKGSGKRCFGGTIVLYRQLEPGQPQCIALDGQGIGLELGFFDVRSPTFILLARHEGVLPLVHADLYRLEPLAVPVFELEESLEEGAFLVVEWGERWLFPPQEDRWDVYLRYDDEDEADSARSVSIRAYGKRAEKQLLSAIQSLRDLGWRVDG